MKHILIIGGGVAGCSLAWQLVKKGINVKLLDRKENHSSFVAAGMINPIVFRRMNLSWRVDEFLPEAKTYYSELEKETGQTFFTPLTIRRFFASEQERNFWIKKQDEKEYKDFLTCQNNFDSPVDKSRNKWGSGIVKNGFRVNAKVCMHELHKLLISKKILKYEAFNHSRFKISEREYEGMQYDAVVFCCGSENDNLPYFQKVNIEHTKGQIISISSKELNEKECWNRKGFLLPIGNQKFKVGATIEREINNVKHTVQAKQELQAILEGMSDANFEIEGQEAGIRPTVYDRRPVMGEHPDRKGLYIFNGLGTKGYLLAPLLSLEMANHILYKAKLNKECCLSRFYKT